jgi:NADH-quinone oxidoreductase subunit G
MLANISVHEPKPPQDPDTPLSFSMEGYEGRPPASLISRYWSPGWNSVQALNKFQREIGGPLEGGDPGKRLIEPKQDAKPAYFTNIPSPSKLKPEDASVPRYSIFGSEELSSYSRAVVEAAIVKPNKGASS